MPTLSGLRILWEHLGWRKQVVASSSAADHDVALLDTGDLSRYWKAIDTAAQWAGYDAGVTLTEAPNALVIPGADYLVANGFSVDLRRSADGTPVGTTIGALTNGLPPFPWMPITASHLAGPDAKHAIAEWNGVPARGWYLHLYGTVTLPARLAGGWFLGTRTELPKSPAMPGRLYGANRTYRGADIELSWQAMPFLDARRLAQIIAAITDNAAEGFVETVAGSGYGPLPVWFHDVTGRTFNGTSGVPALLPVFCTTPTQAITAALAPNIEQGPVSTRWRVRR